MKHLVAALLALLGIVDLVIFVQFFETLGMSSTFWWYHLVIGVISIILIRLIPNRYRTYPYILFFILPGFGPLGYGLIQFSVVYFEYNQTLLFEYEKYILYEKMLDLQFQSTFSADVKTLSIQDQFNYSEHDTKKDMISSMLSGQDSDYSYLLKDSLEDQDYEVTHYAATALNAFENKFEERIGHTRAEYLAKPSPQNLIYYLDATEQYLDSKLMDPAVEKIIRVDYLTLLYKQMEIEPDSHAIYVKILHSLFLLDQDEELLKTLRHFMHLYPKDTEGQLIIMNYLYKNKMFAKLSAFAQSMRKTYDKIPKNLETHVSYWSREGGVS